MRRLGVRNQVLAIEVVDRREVEFPNVGDMLIRDPETDFERYVNTADAGRPGPDGRGQRRPAGTNPDRPSSCWCRAHPAPHRPGLGARHRPLRAGLPPRGEHAARAAAGSDQVNRRRDPADVSGVLPPARFASPERLLILLVIPLLVPAYVFATRRKNRRGMRFTNTSMLDVVVPKQSQWRRHLAVALSLLSLITLTAAFARPKTQVDVPARAGDGRAGHRRLAVDAGDRRAAEPAGRGQAGGDRSSCGSCPRSTTCRSSRWPARRSILVPPTLQHNTVENAINSIKLQDSTAIGEGIDTAHARPAAGAEGPGAPGRSRRPARSCCSATGPTPPAGRRSRRPPRRGKASVPVYTIAYGTENGYVDLDGKREPVPVDHEQMQQIAQSAAASTSPRRRRSSCSTVYQNIGSEVGYEKADREVTARFAGYGLAFAVLAALGAISLGARWP